MSIQSLYTAGTGMAGMQSRLDVVANNLSNMETTGFKRSRANFEDAFYRNERLPGLEDSAGQLTPTGIAYGTGVRVQSVQQEHSQGALQSTGKELDVAIQGYGYFKVRDQSGGSGLTVGSTPSTTAYIAFRMTPSTACRSWLTSSQN